MEYSLPLLTLGLLLSLKHFVADGPLQTPYMYLNKGQFMHPGGLIHAGVHALGTLLALAVTGICFSGVLPALIAGLVVMDFAIHYGVDLTKVRLTKKYGWSAMGTDAQGKPSLNIYNNMFFVALVADQCLHFATYVGIMAAFMAWGL